MKLISNLEISVAITKKHGLFFTQIWDIDSMNLIFEEESLTLQGAENTAATWLVKELSARRQPE